VRSLRVRPFQLDLSYQTKFVIPSHVGSVLVTSKQERSGQLGSVRTKLIHLVSLWVGPREIPVFMSDQIERLPVSLPQVRSF